MQHISSVLTLLVKEYKIAIVNQLIFAAVNFRVFVFMGIFAAINK